MVDTLVLTFRMALRMTVAIELLATAFPGKEGYNFINNTLREPQESKHSEVFCDDMAQSTFQIWWSLASKDLEGQDCKIYSGLKTTALIGEGWYIYLLAVLIINKLLACFLLVFFLQTTRRAQLNWLHPLARMVGGATARGRQIQQHLHQVRF